MKRSEAIDRAIELGKQDRVNNLPVQNHYDDDTLHEAYLRGYDPDGTIVPYVNVAIEAINRREMSVVLNCLIYQDDSCRIYAYRNPEQESAIVNYESDNSIQYVPAYNERHAAYLIVRW